MRGEPAHALKINEGKDRWIGVDRGLQIRQIDRWTMSSGKIKKSPNVEVSRGKDGD